MPEFYRHGAQVLAVELTGRRNGLQMRINDAPAMVATATEAENGPIRLVVNGAIYAGWRYRQGGECFLRLNGNTLRLQQEGLGGNAEGEGGDRDNIGAIMPGMVVAIACSAGQEILKGQAIMTIESMKMQTTIVAPRNGVVECVHVAERAVFEKGAALVSLRPEAA